MRYVFIDVSVARWLLGVRRDCKIFSTAAMSQQGIAQFEATRRGSDEAVRVCTVVQRQRAPHNRRVHRIGQQ
jgi:hypothetical protein